MRLQNAIRKSLADSRSALHAGLHNPFMLAPHDLPALHGVRVVDFVRIAPPRPSPTHTRHIHRVLEEIELFCTDSALLSSSWNATTVSSPASLSCRCPMRRALCDGCACLPGCEYGTRRGRVCGSLRLVFRVACSEEG